eukprot:GEMP01040091.1.p1 GENE.GEMP01040091.1~~GEMP01040091.1.p1  ORF type:complete len:120 (-),score=20.53 GEMP01040091.1:1506-1865(-)
MPWYDWFPYEPNNPVSPQLGPYAVKCQENTKYEWCACGRSQTQPWCDGSHKGTGFKPVQWVPRITAVMMLCGCKHGEYAPRCNGTHMLVRANKNTPAAAAAVFGGMFAFGIVSSWIMHP